jgi:hypothetical protein
VSTNTTLDIFSFSSFSSHIIELLTKDDNHSPFFLIKTHAVLSSHAFGAKHRIASNQINPPEIVEEL